MLKHYGGVLILYHFRVLDWRKDMRSTLTLFMVGSWGLVPSTYFICLYSPGKDSISFAHTNV